jgi:hypothetical protein
LPSLKLKAEQVVESSKGEVKGNGKFWVYHPPLATQSETQTLSAELKDKGFDNYIVHSANSRAACRLACSARRRSQGHAGTGESAGFDKVAIEQKGLKSAATVLSFKALDASRPSVCRHCKSV